MPGAACDDDAEADRQGGGQQQSCKKMKVTVAVRSTMPDPRVFARI